MKRLAELLGKNNADPIQKQNSLRQRLDGTLQKAM